MNYLKKTFRYVEIEYNLYIFKFKSRYLRWLKDGRNDNLLDRWFRHNGEYGSFNIKIFFIKNGWKEKINDKKITKVLENMGEIGDEIIGIRTSEDKGEFNDRWYYSQQITYTLKEEYFIPIEESDKYTIIDENKINEQVEEESLDELESDDLYPEEDAPFASEPIEKLELSVKAFNCLKRAPINSIGALLDYTQEDLLEIKNFGQDSANEAIQKLPEKFGIILPIENNK